MKKKGKSTLNSNEIVFSTDPAFSFGEDQKPLETLPESQQKLRVKIDTRQRAGKAVTLVQGFAGNNEDLEQLGKKLKNFCGTGGSVKEGEIIVQGDQREKVLQWLQKNGYGRSAIVK